MLHVLVVGGCTVGLEVDELHRSLEYQCTPGVVEAEGRLPVEPIVEAEVVQERELRGSVATVVIERGLPQRAGAHITIGDVGIDGEIGSRSELEVAKLLHAAVTDIDEWSRLHGVVVDGVGVGILVHCRQLAPSCRVALGEGQLVDLRAVLILRGAHLEGTWVEVLVHACTVEEILVERSIHVERHLLQAKVVGLVVERTLESLLSELRLRVDGIADVASGDSRL